MPRKPPDIKDVQASFPLRHGEKPEDVERRLDAIVPLGPAQQAEAALEDVEHEAREEAAIAARDEVLRLARADARARKWLRKVGVPDGLSGTEAEGWADGQLVNLLPYAIALLKRNLLYGDDAQQERAAQRVLDATGRGKRDIAGGGGAAIVIINNSGESARPPWRRASHATVDVSPTKPKGRK